MPNLKIYVAFVEIAAFVSVKFLISCTQTSFF